MSFNKSFPILIEKSYNNCKDISITEIPLVKVKSKIMGNKIISLPFIGVVRLGRLSREGILQLVEKKEKVEIKKKKFVSFYIHAMFEGRYKVRPLEQMVLELKKQSLISKRIGDKI